MKNTNDMRHEMKYIQSNTHRFLFFYLIQILTLVLLPSAKAEETLCESFPRSIEELNTLEQKRLRFSLCHIGPFEVRVSRNEISDSPYDGTIEQILRSYPNTDFALRRTSPNTSDVYFHMDGSWVSSIDFIGKHPVTYKYWSLPEDKIQDGLDRKNRKWLNGKLFRCNVNDSCVTYYDVFFCENAEIEQLQIIVKLPEGLEQIDNYLNVHLQVTQILKKVNKIGCEGEN